MEKESTASNTKGKMIFWLHVLLVVCAWTGPFLFSWQYMVTGFAIIQCQFYYFNACLMNEAHDLQEEGDTTFYSHLFETWGYHPNKKKLKFFVRQILYIALAIFTVFWQVYLGNESIIF